MYKLSNKPTAIPAFLFATCIFPNAISELGGIASRKMTISIRCCDNAPIRLSPVGRMLLAREF